MLSSFIYSVTSFVHSIHPFVLCLFVYSLSKYSLLCARSFRKATYPVLLREGSEFEARLGNRVKTPASKKKKTLRKACCSLMFNYKESGNANVLIYNYNLKIIGTHLHWRVPGSFATISTFFLCWG